MALQLQAQPGDAQALKACIAASYANTSVSVQAAAAAPTNIFGTPSICLSTPDGVTLSEPNAAARYILGRYFCDLSAGSIAWASA